MKQQVAVELFAEDSPEALKHAINEWMTDPSEHNGIVSVQYQATATKTMRGDYHSGYSYVPTIYYSALVHYVLPEGGEQ